ncbi:MAG: prepilin peptidase [Anaerolineales bacterium]|nr:prepilin peptidase [Anaerolineales bacterium]
MYHDEYRGNWQRVEKRPLAVLAFLLSILGLANDLLGIISSYDVAFIKVNLIWESMLQSSAIPLWSPAMWPMQLSFYTALTTITFYELREQIIPHAVTIPGIVIGVGMAIGFKHISVVDSLLGILIGFGIPYLLVIIPRKLANTDALGMGVPFLYCMIGAYIGLKNFWTFYLLSILILGLYAMFAVVFYIIKYKDVSAAYRQTFETGPIIALCALIYTIVPTNVWLAG